MGSIPPCGELATSRNGKYALAVSENVAQLCDLDEFQPLNQFPVRWDPGGRRAAVAADGRACLTGCFSGGVFMYDLPGGNIRWTRDDIDELQSLSIDPAKSICFCRDDSNRVHVLGMQHGNTIRVLLNTRKLSRDSFSNAAVRLSEHYEYVDDYAAGPRYAIAPRTFAPLAIAFAPDCWALSESGGPLRAFDKQSGEELWSRYNESSHYTHLAYCTAPRELTVIRWEYKRTGETFLEQLNLSTGATVRSTRISKHGIRVWLAREGTIAVSSALDAWDASTGNRLT